MNKKLLVSCAFVGLCLPLHAATYYVATTGSDENPGTDESPWATVRQGLSSLVPGDTLIVHGGEYREILGEQTPVRITPGTEQAPVLVQAAPGERPVIKGLFWLNRPSYWTIDGINVTWQEGVSPRCHMVRLVNGVRWTFKNAEVWGAHSYSGILVGHTDSVTDLFNGFNEPADWRISDCVIHDTYQSNNTNQDHLIYVNNGLNAGEGTIERNILYNATNGEGIKLGGAHSWEGTVNVTVRYNTVYNTSQAVLVAWLSANNRIYRNMFEKVEDNYGFIRGFRLSGLGNEAWDNGGDHARTFILNDPEFVGVLDKGNALDLGPQVKILMNNIVCFLPNPASNEYGRFATEPPPQ